MSAQAPTGLKKWSTFLKQRVLRWMKWDPEFKGYLPEHQDEYRFPSPGTQGRPNTPAQGFIRRFTVKYFDRDVRNNREEIRQMVFAYRQTIIEEPARLMPGETVGPFYGWGFENKKTVTFHEAENKQIYTYARPRPDFLPERLQAEQAEEIKKLRSEQHRIQLAAKP